MPNTRNRVSHSIVETCLRWNGRCVMGFVANFIRFLVVQKFWESVKIWQSYGEFKGGNFFWDTVLIVGRRCMVTLTMSLSFTLSFYIRHIPRTQLITQIKLMCSSSVFERLHKLKAAVVISSSHMEPMTITEFILPYTVADASHWMPLCLLSDLWSGSPAQKTVKQNSAKQCPQFCCQ